MMAHHKPPTKISVYDEARLRRQRKSSRPKLTKRGRHVGYAPPNPHPDGAPPSTNWVLAMYPLERKRRKQRAEAKRKDRRIQLRRDAREAMREEDDE